MEGNGTASRSISNGNAGTRTAGNVARSAGNAGNSNGAPRQASTASFSREEIGSSGGSDRSSGGSNGQGQQPQRLRNRSDVDGSTWGPKRKTNEDEILAMMSDRGEETSIAFGAGRGEENEGEDDPILGDDGEGVDELLGVGDDDDAGAREDAGDGETGGEQGEEQAQPDQDDIDLEIDQTRIAARFLIAQGWNKDEVVAMLRNSPEQLVNIAQREASKGQGQQQAQQGAEPTDFDARLDKALEPAMKGLIETFDAEGDNSTSKAMVEPIRAAMRFMKDAVMVELNQLHQRLEQYGAELEGERLTSARKALEAEFPALANDQQYAAVRKKMGQIKGGGQKTIAALMRDASQIVLGKQTNAQRRVQETRRNQQRSMGSGAEGVGHAPSQVREITRDKGYEVIHALIEKGWDRPRIDEYMRKNYRIVKAKPKGDA